MSNRLGAATSPYLRQHAENPVDWYEWGDDAFAAARERDVPILLSVGYAACHWCHVMAHESFEDDGVAALMNAAFVNVKVDREERPDIDAVYMEATTALTGHGGWPMTCILTPTGEPFFAGTYFPKPNFVALLQAVQRAWVDDRDEVLAAGQRVVTALAQQSLPVGDEAITADDLAAAAAKLVGQHDTARGGFGGAPKFPPSMVLEFLLRHHERTGDEPSLAAATHTLEAMARGGIYDQLGGGFARYSVDAGWVVPHFEKMLYDNALLLRAYTHWYRRTGSPLAARVVAETAEFLLRDLRTDEGGFASSLDADTDGVEGLTYAWTPTQLQEVLGDDAAAAAELFTVTTAGTFEHGASTLQLRRDPDDAEWFASTRERLWAAREQRAQPGRDDKVVTAWNGLAIGALAEAAVVFDQPPWLAAAGHAAELLASTHLVDGRWRRASRDGVVGGALAVAEDYGDLADGLLLLHQATGDIRWLTTAGHLLDDALDLFGADDGGFFDAGRDAEQLVRRPRDPSDNATPSGASAIANALVGYAALTGSGRHREAADAALQVARPLAVAQPRFLGWGLAAAEALESGPVQVAIVGDAGELRALAWRRRPPGAVVVAGEPDAPGQPLLAQRPLLAGGPAAYVCRGFVCDRPVGTAADLLTLLG